MGYKLVYTLRGQPQERSLEKTGFTVGRDSRNDLSVPDDTSVSRHHARLDFDGQHWKVVDTRSKNRVQVNGAFIDPDEAGARRLEDGDVVSLGSFRLRFVREETGRLRLAEGDLGVAARPVRYVSDFARLLAGERAGPPLPPEAERAISHAQRILKVVTALGQRMAGVKPLDDLLDSLVDLVFESTPAERAALLLYEDPLRGLVPKVVRSRSGREVGEINVPRSIVYRAFEERCAVQMEPDLSPSAPVELLGLRSAVAVPLGDEKRAIGVIYADSAMSEGIFDGFSLGLLSAVAGYAAVAIEQARLLRQLHQEERDKERLGRYHARAVVERILAAADSSRDLALKAQEAEVTVLFCDMANFTALTESLSPQEVMLILNRYFGHMTEVVFEHEGTLDKFLGDGLMAVFGAPFDQPDHARRAALTALGLRDVARRLQASSGLELDFRIGMSSGRVVAGDVGHVLRREWTVLGSTVNLASRMESSVAGAGQIALSGQTRALLGDEFEVRPIEIAKLPKGISREIEAWELLGQKA